MRIPDTVSIVLSVAERKEGRDLAWKFLQENWSELSRRYGVSVYQDSGIGPTPFPVFLFDISIGSIKHLGIVFVTF